MVDQDDLATRFYPEKAAGGFSSVDGTIEFYARVNALVKPTMRVLDFGAGRGGWYSDDPESYGSKLRNLRGMVDSVVGCDVDIAVLENRALDTSVVIDHGARLPFGDHEFDLIVSDYVFEHIDDPDLTAAELDRVLRPGGWICARTPNRRGYVSLLTRLIPNDRHVRVLRRAQPERQAEDVFPTRFRLNTKRAIQRVFPPDRFNDYTYYYEAEPAYNFGSPTVYALMIFVNSVLPRALRSSLFIFLQKRST